MIMFSGWVPTSKPEIPTADQIQKLLKDILPYYIKENMGEGVRLKNEFMIENQSNEQSKQSQHPQPQNKSENLLKETPTNNNIWANYNDLTATSL